MSGSANPGLVHADLLGGRAGRQFRADRLDAQGAADPIVCSFRHDGALLGPLVVADISPTGIGVMTEGRLVASQGSPVVDLTITQRGRVLWEGDGAVVYQVDTPAARMGIRFTSSLFDFTTSR